MNKREKLKADLKRLDRIDEDIFRLEMALGNIDESRCFSIGVPLYQEVEIDYNAYEEIKTILSTQLSHLKDEKKVLEIELGVDE